MRQLCEVDVYRGFQHSSADNLKFNRRHHISVPKFHKPFPQRPNCFPILSLWLSFFSLSYPTPFRTTPHPNTPHPNTHPYPLSPKLKVLPTLLYRAIHLLLSPRPIQTMPWGFPFLPKWLIFPTKMTFPFMGFQHLTLKWKYFSLP